MVTQADIDNLKAVMIKGEKSFKLNGREIVYRSMAEMKEALIMFQKELDDFNNVEKPKKRGMYFRMKLKGGGCNG